MYTISITSIAPQAIFIQRSIGFSPSETKTPAEAGVQLRPYGAT
jgi:hypothetical protein